MNEYTFEDLIMNPENQSLEGLIGKEVYYGNVPRYCLKYANEKSNFGILKEICKDDTYPFQVKNKMGNILAFICIIPKKEPKPKYVPFESMEEFIKKYNEERDIVAFGSLEDSLLRCGMWLKDKIRDVYCLVTEIWNDGVVVGDIRMNTTKDGDEYFTINEATKWKPLLMEYTFLDGSPCGKEVTE